MSNVNGFGLMEVFTQRWLDGTSIGAVDKESTTVRSIQDHLSRLLNARQGVLSHLPDYGLPDITALYGDLPYTVTQLKTAIALCIEKYEPRLKYVEINALPDDRAKGVVILEIQAILQGGEHATFHTYLTSDGDAKVLPGQTDE